MPTSFHSNKMLLAPDSHAAFAEVRCFPATAHRRSPIRVSSPNLTPSAGFGFAPQINVEDPNQMHMQGNCSLEHL